MSISPPDPPLALTAPDGGRVLVAAHGAHVLSWEPAPGDERLFLSATTAWRDGAAIRGGVPVIFPQFAAEGPLPRHGFARTRAWTPQPDGALALEDDAGTRAIWPHPFRAELRATPGAGALEIALSVTNRGDAPLAFTGALHTYLRVANVGDIRLHGLAGVRYRDTAAGGTRAEPDDAPLAIAGEVDRVYLDVPGPVTLREPARALRIESQGFPDVVVWNPGAERAAALRDLEPDGWRRFVCVEAAAVARPVTVAPGETWSGAQRLVIIPA